jgi:hypothetical protein
MMRRTQVKRKSRPAVHPEPALGPSCPHILAGWLVVDCLCDSMGIDVQAKEQDPVNLGLGVQRRAVIEDG